MDIYEALNEETAAKVSLITMSKGASKAGGWAALPYKKFLEVAREFQAGLRSCDGLRCSQTTARGPNRITVAPPRHTAAPIKSHLSGRAPSTAHIQISEAAMYTPPYAAYARPA